MAETSHRQDLITHPDYAELQERAARITASGEAVAIDGLVLLAGAWLAIAPWVIGFSTTNRGLTVNDLILGILVTVLALGLTMAPERMYRLSWAMVAIGLWVIAAPFVMAGPSGFGITSGMYWTNIATGAVITVLGFAAVGLLMATGRGARAARR